MHKRIISYIGKCLSPYLCEYRRGYSTQTAIIVQLDKWQESVDNKGFTSVVLMDLCKDLNYMPIVLVNKLLNYCFDNT